MQVNHLPENMRVRSLLCLTLFFLKLELDHRAKKILVDFLGLLCRIMMNVEEKGKQPTFSTDEGSISGRYIFIVATFVARCDDTIHPIRFYKTSKIKNPYWL